MEVMNYMKTKVENKSTKTNSMQFQKYYNQIPKKQRELDFSKLSNYRCYANGHGEK